MREITSADVVYGTLSSKVSSPGAAASLASGSASRASGGLLPPGTDRASRDGDELGDLRRPVPAHIMAYCGLCARNPRVFTQADERRWETDNPAPVVHSPGATALVVGVGSIGAGNAQLCAVFGMRVIGVDPRQGQAAGWSQRDASARLSGSVAAARRLRHPDDAAYAEDRGCLISTVQADEAVGVFHQHRPGNDDEARRPESRPCATVSLPARTRRLRDRTAARRSPAVEGARRSADPHAAADGPDLEPRAKPSSSRMRAGLRQVSR